MSAAFLVPDKLWIPVLRKAADFPERTIDDGDPYNYFYDGDLNKGYDYRIICSENNTTWEYN